MKHPCVDVAKYLYPAFNALIAHELTEKYGVRRSEVAKLMGVTPAAVTQYLKYSRGNRLVPLLRSEPTIMERIALFAKNLVERGGNSHDLIEIFQSVCSEARKRGVVPIMDSRAR